jgi:hypothetical protein
VSEKSDLDEDGVLLNTFTLTNYETWKPIISVSEKSDLDEDGVLLNTFTLTNYETWKPIISVSEKSDFDVLGPSREICLGKRFFLNKSPLKL